MANSSGVAGILLVSSGVALSYNVVHSLMIQKTSAVTTTVLGDLGQGARRSCRTCWSPEHLLGLADHAGHVGHLNICSSQKPECLRHWRCFSLAAWLDQHGVSPKEALRAASVHDALLPSFDSAKYLSAVCIRAASLLRPPAKHSGCQLELIVKAFAAGEAKIVGLLIMSALLFGEQSSHVLDLAQA